MTCSRPQPMTRFTDWGPDPLMAGWCGELKLRRFLCWVFGFRDFFDDIVWSTPTTQDAIVTNEGLGWDSILKYNVILMVTVTGKGVNPNDEFLLLEFFHVFSNCFIAPCFFFVRKSGTWGFSSVFSASAWIWFWCRHSHAAKETDFTNPIIQNIQIFNFQISNHPKYPKYPTSISNKISKYGKLIGWFSLNDRL